MKQNRALAAKSLITLPILLSFTVSTSVVYAQTVSAEMSKTAKQACKESAVNKGYKVVEVVSVSPKGTDGANVVLNLTKAGHPARLTCGYTKAGGAAFGEDKAVATSAPVTSPVATAQTAPVVAPEEHHGFPWWLLLLPLLAIPFFLRRKPPAIVETPTRSGAGVYDNIEQYEGIIENNGSAVEVYSQPNSSSKVISSLSDGQRVTLSGSQDNNWSQLTDGGWIPTRYVRRQVR